MATHITKLTPDQWEQVETCRREWLAHGINTAPADRPTTERAITEMYRLMGKPAPQYVWVDSPAAAHVALWLLSDTPGNSMKGQLGDQLRGQLGGQLRGQLRGQLGGQLGDQLGDQLWDQLRDQLGGQLGGQLRGQLGGQLRDQLRGQLRGQLWESVDRNLWRAFWGQQEAYWTAFYEVPRRLGIATYDGETNRRLNLWIDLARSAHWWWPYDRICVLSERPAEVHFDPQGRLHNATGPAVLYRDGWALHSWHGTRVPADLVAGSWTTERIFQERNSEVRRCAIEKIGWDVFVEQSGLDLVAIAPDPGNAPHELALYDLPDALRDMYDEEARILLCTNGTIEPDGTRRRFGLPVPAHHTDPVAAAADLYGWPVESYRQLEVRR